VNAPEFSLNELRRALIEENQGADEPVEDVARVWAAAAGELSPEETTEMVDRMVASPALMEAWQLAVAMQRQMQPAAPPAPVPLLRPSPARTWGWAAGLAAAAMLAIGIVLPLLRERGPTAVERYRGERTAAGDSLLEEGAALPREAFLLRWWPGPRGAVYAVVVTDEMLAPIAEGKGLENNRFQVPAGALARVPDGATVLWQVTMSEGGGTLVRSMTHRQRVAP
jgi:hypothetical protein